uniref:HMG box domain-containing protein n=1 Tax=Bionectria ochroleuca TaxID=29856 RepID=A0A8H7TNE5_BIOOC
MLTLTAKAVARRAATSYLAGSSSLTTRFSALAIRPIAVRSFSVYRSPLLAATRRSTTAKKTTTTTKKATTKTAKKAAPEKPEKKAAKKPAAKKPAAKKKVGRKKKELTPEEAEKADIKKWKKQALWNQEPAAGNGSGWAIYVGEQFTGQKFDDGTTITDKMRVLRDKWNELSDYDKERYKSQAEVEAVQRKKQRKEWIESHSIEEIHLANQARLLLQRKYNKKSPRLHDERKRKRPTSAFVRFFVSYFNSLDPEAPKVESRNRFEGASARWKAMSDEEKAPYVKEYQEEMKRFQEENAGFQDRIDELRKSVSAK